MVYVAEKRQQNLQAFADLHKRCRTEGHGLKSWASVSTPNLEWAVLLVAVQQPTTCFYCYLLPFKPKLDARPGITYDTSWLDRRLKERRNMEDNDIKVWRRDLYVWQPDPKTGIPSAELNVRIGGYWASSSSSVLSQMHNAPGGGMHTSLIKSVLPGHTFMYSMWPWRAGPSGYLEPSRADQHPSFLQDCRCSPDTCGKLDARRALKDLREGGIQYQLVARRAPFDKDSLLQLQMRRPKKDANVVSRTSCSTPGTASGAATSSSQVPSAASMGAPQLGVYADEMIPEGVYLMEYVGELLTQKQDSDRAQLYVSAQLHYLYGMEHRSALCKADLAHAMQTLDATHIGNISRLINHRCEGASLQAVNVCMGGVDETHMCILLRTKRNLLRNDELTVDYNSGISTEEKEAIRTKKGKKGEVECRCGADRCLGVVHPYRLGAAGPRAARRTAPVGTRTDHNPTLTATPLASPSTTTGTVGTNAASLDDADTGRSGRASASSPGVAAPVAAAAAAVAAGGSEDDCPSGNHGGVLDDATADYKRMRPREAGSAAGGVMCGSVLKARRKAEATSSGLTAGPAAVPGRDQSMPSNAAAAAAEADAAEADAAEADAAEADAVLGHHSPDDNASPSKHPSKALRRTF